MENYHQENSNSWISADRQKALADGVFAIVMTLLVLELSVPVIHGGNNHELTQALAAMWPKFVAYTLSFLILGVFWLVHHFLFDVIKYYDTRLAWLNIIFLLFVALVPFTTSLLGEYLLQKTPAIIYGVQLLAVFFMGFVIWSYATSQKLYDAEVDSRFVRGGRRMGYLYFVILITAIILAFFVPFVSILIYAAFVLLFILITAFGRAEYAVTLNTGKTAKN